MDGLDKALVIEKNKDLSEDKLNQDSLKSQEPDFDPTKAYTFLALMVITLVLENVGYGGLSFAFGFDGASAGDKFFDIATYFP